MAAVNTFILSLEIGVMPYLTVDECGLIARVTKAAAKQVRYHYHDIIIFSLQNECPIINIKKFRQGRITFLKAEDRMKMLHSMEQIDINNSRAFSMLSATASLIRTASTLFGIHHKICGMSPTNLMNIHFPAMITEMRNIVQKQGISFLNHTRNDYLLSLKITLELAPLSIHQREVELIRALKQMNSVAAEMLLESGPISDRLRGPILIMSVRRNYVELTRKILASGFVIELIKNDALRIAKTHNNEEIIAIDFFRN